MRHKALMAALTDAREKAGLTQRELARRLGIKRNTLDQRICRAMKVIRLRVKR